MDAVSVSNLIQNGIEVILVIAAYLIFFKENLRCSPLVTSVVFLLYYAVFTIPQELNFHLSGIYYSLLTLAGLPIKFGLVKKNCINSGSFFSLWQYFSMMISTIIISIVYGLISSGADQDAQWYDKNTGGLIMFLVTDLALTVGMLIAFLIFRRRQKVFLEFSGRTKITVLLLGAIIPIIFNAAKMIFVNESGYSNSPDGLGLVLDAIGMASVLAALLFIVVHFVRTKGSERRTLRAGLQEADKAYSEAEEIQKELRALNHEMRNLTDNSGEDIE